ncbi:MAG: MATE family efflux transporter [Chlorobi bacterium]|nr:MATE family efflux transporter [Chlorobiota bacterium]
MNRKILQLAIPNIITNITVPLLGMADLAILGRLDNPAYIGAIALGGTIFNFLYWGFGFLRMGTSGFTAQSFGSNNKTEIIMTFVRAILIALAGSTIILLLQKPIDYFSFLIFKGEADVELFASEYFRIRVWAAPATLSLYVFYGWFLGIQNAKAPMAIAIVINILNIIFNVFFVFYLGMKSDGVALGTVLAQYIGLIMAITIFYKKYRKYFKHYSLQALKQINALKLFLSVNKDILLRTLLLIFVLSFFTAKSAEQGNIILAVNTLLFQFFFLFSYFVDGFAYAAEALVGKYIGANDNLNLKKSIISLFKWGVGLSLPFTLIFLFWGDVLLRILSDNVEIIEASKPYMFWIVLIPILSFAAFLWDGIYVGATASKAMLITMLLASFIIFMPVYYFTQSSLGNHGLWLSLILFLFGRGLFQTLWAPKAIFKFKPSIF